MERYSLKSLMNLLSASNVNGDAQFPTISIDTRQLQRGDCYLALIGDNFDGHDFINEAKEKGAVAAIVSRNVQTTLPYLLVEDTRIALGLIAAEKRKHYTQPVIGLTGSCGKTTTKEMITSILQLNRPTLCPINSFNNDVGVPLTLMKLNDRFGYAVVEIGTNHPGEIAYLTNITKPDIALITNVGPVHLEGFGSVAAIAEEKGAIFSCLKENGIAILNRDDDFYDFWLSNLNGHESMSFGVEKTADVWVDKIILNNQTQAHFQLNYGRESIDIQLQILGEHNVINACAAATVALAVGLTLENVKSGLESVPAVNKRGVTVKGLRDVEIIDDTYNANPVSFLAAIKTLANRSGETILVMGDMKELGENAEYYHSEIGEQAKAHGINKLYAVGELSKAATEAFGHNGYHFMNKQTLINELQSQLHKDMSILVKGSRSVKMEDVVAGLQSNN